MSATPVGRAEAVEFPGTAHPAALEPPARREARLRRLGRLARLGKRSLAVFLGPDAGGALILPRFFGCRTVVIDRDAVTRERLERDARAAGVAERFEVRDLDPLAAAPPDIGGGADLLLAEGLAAARGLSAAAQALRPLLAEDGLLALHLRVALGREVPEQVRRYWEARWSGPLRTVPETLARLSSLLLEPMTCELLAPAAWDAWYAEQERFLIAMGDRDGDGTGGAGRALADLREERRVHEAGGRTSTASGWFVGRRVIPGAPPRWPVRGPAT